MCLYSDGIRKKKRKRKKIEGEERDVYRVLVRFKSKKN
jgi:hypothetical protein